VGLGEFAFEEGGDGVDAGVSERGETGEPELIEHAGRDVVARVAARCPVTGRTERTACYRWPTRLATCPILWA
jgi:hypothetical protein